jgi:hypothetical protein
MANVNAHQNASQAPSTHVSPLSGGTRKNVGPGGYAAGVPKTPQYLTAEQEKEAFRRYEEAKMAVDRVHNPYESNGTGPIAYDSLYPKPGGSSSGAGASGAVDAPPPFEASITGSNASAGPMSAMVEKAALAERMRLEEAAGAMHNQAVAPPPSFNAVQDNMQQQYRDAAAEKEDVRKKLEAKDAATAAKRARHQQQRQQSLRNQQQYQQQQQHQPHQSMPQPPSSTQVLTAAEEKARLKAKFEAKDAARMMGQKKVNGMPTPPASPRPQATSFQSSNPQVSQQQHQLMTPVSPLVPTPPPPPPLMPRPPAEYIRETREEDERVSKVVIDGVGLDDEGSEGGSGGGGGGSGRAAGIYMNGNASGSLSKRSLVAMIPGPPPPLPPKPAGE